MVDPNSLYADANNPVGGYLPPIDPERSTNIWDIPVNLVKDVADLGQGFAVIGSLAKTRALETFYGQSPIRPEDLGTASNIVGGIVNHYVTNYVNPVLSGHPEDIAMHWVQHPLDVFDVAPAPPISKLGKPLAAGLKTVPGAAQLGHGAKVFADKATDFLRTNEYTKQLAVPLSKQALQSGIRNQVAQATADAYQATRALLDSKLKAVPAADKAELMQLLEGTAERYYKPGFNFERDIHPATRDYMETLRPIIAQDTQKLKELGSVTAEQVFKDRWLSAAASAAKAFGLTSEELAEIAKNPEALMALIKDAQRFLNRRGVEPIYQGRLSEAQMKNTLAHPYQLPDNTLRVAADKARAAISGEMPTQKTSMEYARTQLQRGAQFSTDSRGVTLARHAQLLQLYNTTKVLLQRMLDAQVDIAKMTPAEIAAKGLVEFYPKEFLGRIGGGLKAFTDEELSTIAGTALSAPDRIHLPGWMVESFERLTTPGKGKIERILTGFANFARRYVLGFNFTLPEWQFAQTTVMLGVTQFRGPRDTIVSLMSYMLALDKKVQAIVPENLLGEQFVADAGHALLPGIAGKAIEKTIDFNFKRLEIYDRAVRYVAAGYYALKLSEKLPELGGPIRGMLSSGEAVERLQKVFASPEAVQDVNKSIMKAIGDFSALQSEKRALLRTTFLWWNWIEAITKHTAMLPMEHPFKLAIGQRIAAMQSELFQDQDLPDTMKQAGAVRIGNQVNPQGIPYYVSGGSVNPYTAPGEIIEQLRQPLEGEESSTILSQMNPIFPIFAAVFFAVNPNTGKEFTSPNMLRYHGKQYDPADVMRGEFKEQRPRPNLLEFAARTLFPTPTRLAERLYAKVTTGGEPTAFTTIGGDPAPRVLFNSGGQPLEATSLQEIVLETMLGTRRVPVDTSSTAKMEQLQQKALRNMRKQAPKQMNPDKLYGGISND
jgi:hypothetical protein